MTRTTPLLGLLLLVCGVASFGSLSGSAPSVALAASSALPLQAAAPVVQAVQLDAPAVAPLERIGTNGDGWAVHRLSDGLLPERLPVGAGFRGEIVWQQGHLERRARIYVPRSAPESAALLVSLHGLNNTLRQVELQQRWSSIAFQQQLVVVWAAGHSGSWNAGPCCGAAAATGVDDLGYLDRLLQVTGALQGIDRRRVHLAGYSNGAMLAYRYACGRPGRIAGVLAVAGTHTAPCRPTRATAILSVHGAKDPTVPLGGTRFSDDLGSPLPPARHAPQLWARTGAGVRSVVLPTYAHGWPTRHDGGYDATGEGWRFLKGHPMP